MTVAMYLANNGLEIEDCWKHDSKLQDKDGNTVAMLLAKHDINPPKDWLHDKYLKNKYG